MLKQLWERLESAVEGSDAEMREASRAMLGALKDRIEAIETHLGIAPTPAPTPALAKEAAPVEQPAGQVEAVALAGGEVSDENQ
jgi:hypothetical protein